MTNHLGFRQLRERTRRLRQIKYGSLTRQPFPPVSHSTKSIQFRSKAQRKAEGQADHAR